MLLEKLPNAIFKLRNIVVLVCVDANHQLSDKNYIKEGRGGEGEDFHCSWKIQQKAHFTEQVLNSIQFSSLKTDFVIETRKFL